MCTLCGTQIRVVGLYVVACVKERGEGEDLRNFKYVNFFNEEPRPCFLFTYVCFVCRATMLKRKSKRWNHITSRRDEGVVRRAHLNPPIHLPTHRLFSYFVRRVHRAERTEASERQPGRASAHGLHHAASIGEARDCRHTVSISLCVAGGGR